MFWIIVGILVFFYLVYKAFDGSILAWIILIAGVVVLSIAYWEYLSFILAASGIAIILWSIVFYIGAKVSESRESEKSIDDVVKKQESDQFDITDSSSVSGMMKNNNVLAMEDPVFAECLSEMKKIEEELLPMINEMAKKIDASYSSVAKTVSDIADIVVDYSDGILSEKGRRNAMVIGFLASAVIEGIGKWKAEQKKKEELNRLLVKKKDFANAHLSQVEQIIPKLEKNRELMRKLVEKVIVKPKYDFNTLMNHDFVDNVKDNACKTLALYRQALYYDKLVFYLQDEYYAWLSGQQKSSTPPVTLYDVNQLIAKDVFGSDDDLKSELMLCLERTDTANRIPCSDIVIMGDLNLCAFAMVSNGGTYFKDEMVAKGSVARHLLENNSVYANYRERYEVYQDYVINEPSGRWGYAGLLLPAFAVLYSLFGNMLDETWQLVAGVVIVVVFFLLSVWQDCARRKEEYKKAVAELKRCNQKIFNKIVGFYK